jgi:hypothetical protein
MNCLVCGNKLAIFRKLSLGDFCCQEHRSLFLKEQSDGGLARLMETNSDPRNESKAPSRNESNGASKNETNGAARNRGAGGRLYAQFLHEGLAASSAGADYRGYGPLSQSQIIGPEPARSPFTRLAPACLLECASPEVGVREPIYFETTGISLKLPEGRLPTGRNGSATRLRQAGLILPWSSGAGSQSSFSLASLAAAAWAQSGYSKPMQSSANPMGALQFAWPGVRVNLEAPAGDARFAADMAPASFAAVESPALQPMRVRLANPSAPAHQPKLELPIPAPVTIEDYLAEQPAPEVAPIPPVPTAPPKLSWWHQLASVFTVQQTPERLLSARARAGIRHREEVYTFDDPRAPKTRHTSAEAWRMMFMGWTPSAAIVSGLFAILFLVSAVTMFLSAPSDVSRRSTSFRWDNLRSAIRGRAALKVEDDFRTGLGQWFGPSGWSRDWTYDPAGFLRPGSVGFLQQSMSLVNYRMEFMGQIERKSLGWAFRAKDENNYYVAKLTIARPGPLPIVDLVHYPVTNGKEGPKVSVMLPFSVQNDTLYQVEMNIRGDAFRASVNGHVVDSWTDGALRAGGVGFVSGKGEAARVRWIRVSDHDDVIGRVCSYLSARYSQPSGETVLSASYYTILRSPGMDLFSR